MTGKKPFRLIPMDEVLARTPQSERDAIFARVEEPKQEVEGLKALRELTEHSQQQIAQTLQIKQPAVHKMEKQADLYLSTLRHFVEAAGGKLELVIDLPGKGSFRLTGIGDISLP